MPTTFQSSFPKFGVSEQSNNRLRSVAVETKVRDEMEDLNVLHFQQGVLSIASAFYVDLATLVERTPVNVIRMGMTRSGLGPRGQNLQQTIDDIKDVCAKLVSVRL